MTVTRRYLDASDETKTPVAVTLTAEVQPMPRSWTQRDMRAAARAGRNLPFLVPNSVLAGMPGWYAEEQLLKDLGQHTDAVLANEGVVVGPVEWKEVSRG